MKHINELVQINLEMNILQDIPWRSGQIDLSFGELYHKGLKYYCLVLSNLNWVAQFKPSFMFIIPDLDRFNRINYSSNGSIVYAKQAQHLEYNKILSGKCEVLTKWFGQPKEGRVFDWIHRLFETGFLFTNFIGFDDNKFVKLTKSSQISITTSDYKHPSFLLGKIRPKNEEDKIKLENQKLLEIPARIKRTR